MSRDHIAGSLLFTVAVALGPAACHPGSDDIEPDEPTERRADTMMEGRHIEFALETETTGRDDIAAVAQHLERAHGVSGTRVSVRQQSDDATVVTVDLMGEALPTPDELTADLRGSFSFLADAFIEARVLDPEEFEPDPIEPDSMETPEETRARIVEQLRADGVEGEISVDVRDDADGRREVEVRVERDEDTPAQ